MKGITQFEVLISLSLFLGAFTLVSVIFLNLQSSEIYSLKKEKNLLKSLAISQLMIYSDIYPFSISTLNYTVLNSTKVNEFFNFCNSNKEYIKNFLKVYEFNITLNCNNQIRSCGTRPTEFLIKRPVILNNNICYLSIGVE